MAINERLTERLFTEADRALDRMTRQAKRQLLRAHRESLDRIRLQIAELYERYAQAGKLTYTQMTRYNRLVKLDAEIGRELGRLGVKTRSIMHRSLGDLFEESYERTGHAIEMGARKLYGYMEMPVFDRRLAERSILNPISGLTLDDRLKMHRQQIVWKVKQEVTQGLVRGEGYPDMARRLRETFLGDAVKATRVVQTEAHRVQNEARALASEDAAEAGVLLKKKWVATLDDRTRDTHQSLDGQTVERDGEFTSPTGATAPYPGAFGVSAEDINCRCSHIYVVEGLEPKLRRSREDGIIPYQTYKEWKETRKKA
jgi:SPP1 gp7 family putative phage head morphogenesis protein